MLKLALDGFWLLGALGAVFLLGVFSSQYIKDKISGVPSDLRAALRALGVRLAVDDFGKGYSSLAYLQRFPLDTVKIDQIFFQNLEPGATDHTIVGSVINLAHGLGFEVVAEGVETPQQLDALVEMGCDLVQGHVMAPALPASAAGALLGAPLQPAGLSLSAARAPGPPS